MNINEFSTWAEEVLHIKDYSKCDASQNGLQISRSNTDITKIAFAVDACYSTITKAKELGAEVLFVHHGLFWSKPQTITGILYSRIKELISSDIALFACHLPLDAHPELGNNAVLSKMLKLRDIEPFGEYHGKTIGFKGYVEPSISIEEAVTRILPENGKAINILPFGKKEINTVAVISGAAANDVHDAIDEKIDLYITGESSHSIYNDVEEAGINFIAAGHYNTEIHGVKAVAEYVKKELNISTIFIENPTGL